MEILLVYLAVAALGGAVFAAANPAKAVFWCAPDDRSRFMGILVYTCAALILVITYIVIAPAPQTEAPPQPEIADTTPAPEASPEPLTRPIFLAEVTARLEKTPDFTVDGMQLSLLSFSDAGATAQLTFKKKPHRKIAVDRATRTVKAMLATLKAHKWTIAEPLLLECQVHTDEIIYSGETGHRSMGFARYQIDSGNIAWLDFNG